MHMHLAAEAVARVLQVGDAQAGPCGRVLLVLLEHALKQPAGAVQVVQRAGARHERRQHGARLQILLRQALARAIGAVSRAPSTEAVGVLQIAKALQRGEDFVADLGLHADQVERGDVDGAACAHRLRGDVQQLPVQVEARVRAHEVAGKHEPHQQLFADGERVELLRGDRHQRAGRADDQRGHARQARGDGVGQGVAVERRGRGFSGVGHAPWCRS